MSPTPPSSPLDDRRIQELLALLEETRPTDTFRDGLKARFLAKETRERDSSDRESRRGETVFFLRRNDGTVISLTHFLLVADQGILFAESFAGSAGDTLIRRQGHGPDSHYIMKSCKFAEMPWPHWRLGIDRDVEWSGQWQVKHLSEGGTHMGGGQAREIRSLMDRLICVVESLDVPEKAKRDVRRALVPFLEHPLITILLGSDANEDFNSCD